MGNLTFGKLSFFPNQTVRAIFMRYGTQDPTINGAPAKRWFLELRSPWISNGLKNGGIHYMSPHLYMSGTLISLGLLGLRSKDGTLDSTFHFTTLNGLNISTLSGWVKCMDCLIKSKFVIQQWHFTSNCF